jgi:hypothetical protein
MVLFYSAHNRLAEIAIAAATVDGGGDAVVVGSAFDMD